MNNNNSNNKSKHRQDQSNHRLKIKKYKKSEYEKPCQKKNICKILI